MSLAQLFPVILVAHIVLAVSLFLPSLLLPFALRLRGGKWSESAGRIPRALFWLQRNGTLIIGAGLAVTGVLLVLTLGLQLLSQPWLLLALTIYAANLVLAFFVQRPALARLLRLRPDVSDEAQERWRTWARRQRYISYVMAALIGVIAFLMSTKPDL
ncbi:DUF2269 family protein [Piscinibacter sp.]|uniref:DUF2269 family protein n=1 Tax=Piscinibacter sp. TaxID=1903157 RepID=UPI002B89565F|nr:DUF2269 family protein [Albitalea sp.]HUG26620.1 DUF2269 family protein [Albitalea sp.]